MSFQNIDHVELIAASNASWGSNEEEEGRDPRLANFVVDIVNAKVVYDINESSNNIKRRNCCILFYFILCLTKNCIKGV